MFKTCKDFLTIQTIIGNLLPNTSDTAPIKGQHKNWRRENSDPMKPAARKLHFKVITKLQMAVTNSNSILIEDLHKKPLRPPTSSLYTVFIYSITANSPTLEAIIIVGIFFSYQLTAHIISELIARKAGIKTLYCTVLYASVIHDPTSIYCFTA